LESPIYEKEYKRAASRERPLPRKVVVIVAVEEVFEATGGESAGDRIV
jgi:hypothetical protein